MDFSKIEKDTLEQINSIKNLDELEKIRLSYLGKKGLISQEMKNLVNLEIDEKKELGKKLNTLKNLIQNKIESKRIEIQNINLNKKMLDEKLDLTLPPRNYSNGKIHPISQTINSVINIFSGMGFSVADGPDIETDFHNFTALNIPPNHPAREMQILSILLMKKIRKN